MSSVSCAIAAGIFRLVVIRVIAHKLLWRLCGTIKNPGYWKVHERYGGIWGPGCSHRFQEGILTWDCLVQSDFNVVLLNLAIRFGFCRIRNLVIMDLEYYPTYLQNDSMTEDFDVMIRPWTNLIGRDCILQCNSTIRLRAVIYGNPDCYQAWIRQQSRIQLLTGEKSSINLW